MSNALPPRPERKAPMTMAEQPAGPLTFFNVSKQIPKGVKRHCGMCRQHGVVEQTRNHVCQFKNCECPKCALVRQRRSIMSMQIRLRREQDKMFVRTAEPDQAEVVPPQKMAENATACYFCQKCKNHGILMWKKDHKKTCSFMNCRCEQCLLIDTRRALDVHIKKGRKRPGQDPACSPPSDSGSDHSEPSSTPQSAPPMMGHSSPLLLSSSCPSSFSATFQSSSASPSAAALGSVVEQDTASFCSSNPFAFADQSKPTGVSATSQTYSTPTLPVRTPSSSNADANVLLSADLLLRQLALYSSQESASRAAALPTVPGATVSSAHFDFLSQQQNRLFYQPLPMLSTANTVFSGPTVYSAPPTVASATVSSPLFNAAPASLSSLDLHNIVSNAQNLERLLLLAKNN